MLILKLPIPQPKTTKKKKKIEEEIKFEKFLDLDPWSKSLFVFFMLVSYSPYLT